MKPILKLGVAMLMVTGCLDQAEPVAGDDEAQTAQALSGPNDRVRAIAISNWTVTSTVESTANSPFFGPWGPLGGHDVRKLIVDKNDDGRIMLFAIGGDGQLYARYQTQVGGSWNPDGWGPMGGTGVQQLVSARGQDGRLEIFARFADGHTYHRWQVVKNGGWNTGWSQFDDGRPLSDLSVALRADGRLEVVGIISSGKAIERVQVAPNAGWADFAPVSNDNLVLRQIAISRNAQGYIEMLALDSNGTAQDLVEGIPYFTPSFVSSSGHQLRHPMLAMNGDGRLELFAIGGDNELYTVSQGLPGSSWGTWQDLGAQSDDHIAVASRADGGLVVFATRQPVNNSDVIVQSIMQVAGGWSPWSSPGSNDEVPMMQDVVAIAQPL